MKFRPGTALAYGLATACLVMTASDVYALTLTRPRSDNCQIGAGIIQPQDSDSLYRSKIPPPGGGNGEEVSFEVEVCCTDCNAAGGSGTCGTGNCTVKFTVNWFATLNGGGTSAPQTKNYNPTLGDPNDCPICVTVTCSAVFPLAGDPPGRSTAVNITNVMTECICCTGDNQGQNMWSGHAFTFSRELTPLIVP